LGRIEAEAAQMNDIRTFIDWLSYHPTSDEISRALVMEYMASLGACCARIGRLHPNDSLEFLGEYGFDAGQAKQTFPSEVWRSWESDEALIALGKNAEPWNPSKNLLMIQLRERGAVHGYLVLRFSHPVADTESVEEVARNYAVALGLYLSLAHQAGSGSARNMIERIEPGSDQLTPRQISILRGMVEGKTNHELANELGFSVSTIRHETMRIYQALAVSDRKEAAKKALSLALI
jgi:DNA-binding CsgD family transcriptional regulator